MYYKYFNINEISDGGKVILLARDYKVSYDNHLMTIEKYMKFKYDEVFINEIPYIWNYYYE